MVAVDATFLPYLLRCPTNAPNDPATNQPIEELQERVEFLIETLGEEGETIVVPTPALCEFLVLAKGDGPEYQAKIAKDPLFTVKPFDERAAVELAMIYIEADAKKGRKALKRQTQEQIAEDEKTATVTTSQPLPPTVRPDTVVRIDKSSDIKMEKNSDE